MGAGWGLFLYIRQMPHCPQKTKTSLVHVGLAIFHIINSIGRMNMRILSTFKGAEQAATAKSTMRRK
jgi:hypothetical protein